MGLDMWAESEWVTRAIELEAAYVQQERRQKDIFDRRARRLKSYRLQSWQEAYLKRIFSQLRLQAGDVFLDVGVGGSGYTVIEAARVVREAVGIDLSPESVRKASRCAAEQRLRNVSFATASAEALPFDDGRFTKLCSIAVMEHVEDDERAFDEIKRVVRLGGIIHICVPNTYMHMPLLIAAANIVNDKRVGHLRHYYANDIIRAFERRGFRVEKLEYHGHNVKLAGYALGFVPLPLTVKERLQRWVDRRDLEQMNDPASMNVSLTMVRSR